MEAREGAPVFESSCKSSRQGRCKTGFVSARWPMMKGSESTRSWVTVAASSDTETRSEQHTRKTRGREGGRGRTRRGSQLHHEVKALLLQVLLDGRVNELREGADAAQLHHRRLRHVCGGGAA